MDSLGKEESFDDADKPRGQKTSTTELDDSITHGKEKRISDIEAGNSLEREGREAKNGLSTERPISVKDYAYTEESPMHYGIYREEEQLDEENSGEYPDYEGNLEQDDEQVTEETVFTLKKSVVEDGLEVINESRHDKESQLTTSADHKLRTQDLLRGKSAFTQKQPFRGNQHSRDPDSEQTEPIVQAVALYPFEAENANELGLVPDQLVVINYEYGDGWLVAYNPESGRTGLIPSAYVQILGDENSETADDILEGEETANASRFLPDVLEDEAEADSLDEEDDGKKVDKEEEANVSESVAGNAVVNGIDHLNID